MCVCVGADVYLQLTACGAWEQQLLPVADDDHHHHHDDHDDN